jgi:small subunit ribosomal protein S18
MLGWHAPHGKVTVLGQGPVTSRPRPVGPQVAARRLFVPCRPVGLTGHLFVARCVTQKTHTVRGEESRLAKQRKRPARTRRDRKDGPTSGRRKPCPYCRDKVDRVDYKDVSALRRFISERGKIRSRRITGACRRHQSQVARAVKRA